MKGNAEDVLFGNTESGKNTVFSGNNLVNKFYLPDAEPIDMVPLHSKYSTDKNMFGDEVLSGYTTTEVTIRAGDGSTTNVIEEFFIPCDPLSTRTYFVQGAGAVGKFASGGNKGVKAVSNVLNQAIKTESLVENPNIIDVAQSLMGLNSYNSEGVSDVVDMYKKGEGYVEKAQTFMDYFMDAK